ETYSDLRDTRGPHQLPVRPRPGDDGGDGRDLGRSRRVRSERCRAQHHRHGRSGMMTKSTEQQTGAPSGSQRTWQGPSATERLRMLRAAESVAIVGASAKPARASNFVGTYLLSSSGYRVYFINPREQEILGRPVYGSLADLPEVPDVVD